VEGTTRDYILFLMNYIKNLDAENNALKSLLMTHPDEQTRVQWRFRFQSLLDDPECKAIVDAKFDPHIETILKALDDREAFAALLQTPTKGLPN
jgi:hypothetical protein